MLSKKSLFIFGVQVLLSDAGRHSLSPILF